MIPLTEDFLEKVRQHAIAEYPFECCGIIIGKVETTSDDILFPCTNMQNKLHQKDPETFTRDARTAFYIDPKELLKIFQQAQEKKMVAKIFYHSHPDHDAYFSAEDEKLALFGDEPSYPDARYLVISVYNRKVKGEALFAWNPDRQKFERQNH